MEVWSCILSLIITLLFFIFAVRLIPKSKDFNLPPGPKPFPIIGNLLDVGDNPHKSLTNLAKSYGPIFSLKLGHVITVVISSAEMAREVVQTHDQVLCSRAIPDAATCHDHHKYALVWLPLSPLWRNHRRLCNNRLFSPKILDGNENLRRQKVEELIDSVRRSAAKGETVDIGASVFVVSLNLLSNTIFSIDMASPNSEMAKKFRESVRGMMVEMGKQNIGDYYPALKKFDIQGIKKRVNVYMAKVLEIIDLILNQRLEMQKSPDFIPKNDVLHHLLNVGDENSDLNFDQNQIRHFLLVLFIAGTDTTTTQSQWAMSYMLQNPEIMSKAKAELKQVIGEGNPIEESHIENLQYLQAIIKETLRLQSPFLLPRQAEEEVNIAGFTIPKGTRILVNTWALGRDPNVWDEPELFKPERFLASGLDRFDIRGRNFEYLPFGGGRRICPGLPLGWRMLHLIVGSLVHWFDWKLEDGIQPGNLNMDDKFGLVLDMAQSLRAVPLLA